MKYRKKVIVLFVEYFVFALFFTQLLKFWKYNLSIEGLSNFFLILFICYLIYYSIVEFFMKKSLVMWLFKVELNIETTTNSQFLFYAFLSIFDRTVFVPFHVILTILNYENLLLCEKLSGIRWINKK